ncbi:alpha-1,2-fucosyltransferase [Erwinia rhapontici]|uniref:alpha-1,2-fucosyltransferase n=1 Tax=Erwinia rhapontici TaxID=55212 RepID=UPI003B9F31D8
MKIVNIYGGLGNVLFQVCLALHLKDLGHSVKLDMLGLDSKFKEKVLFFFSKCNIELDECTPTERFRACRAISKKRIKLKELKILKFLFPDKLYTEKEWGDIPSDDFDYYFGYFQNFELAKKYSSVFDNCLNVIADENGFTRAASEGCFIHIRRGDYCTPEALAVHGIVGEDYYNKAIEYFDNEMIFDVYSNDVTWVKENIKSDNIRVIENGQFRYPDIQDLYSMSKYKNGIIANSTFSFWAALIRSDQLNKEIICPEIWFADSKLQKLSYKLKNSEWVYK